jgi:hypothetical protein
MAFQMSLRETATYEYIRDNLVYSSAPIINKDDRYTIPWDTHKGIYYSWKWDSGARKWKLYDSVSAVYTEDDGADKSSGRACPSPLIPYNSYGYFCVGDGGNMKIKKIDLSSYSVSTEQAYSLTGSTRTENGSAKWGPYIFFVTTEFDSGSSASSIELIKLDLTDGSYTQLYSSDDSVTGGVLEAITCGSDGTNVYVGATEERDDGPAFYVPIGGGAKTDISSSEEYLFYGYKAYVRNTGSVQKILLKDLSKEWDMTGKTTMTDPVYIMDDSSYPIYIISGDGTHITQYELNSDESVTTGVELDSTNRGVIHTAPYGMIMKYGPSLIFNATSSSDTVEIRLPYRDVL